MGDEDTFAQHRPTKQKDNGRTLLFCLPQIQQLHLRTGYRHLMSHDMAHIGKSLTCDMAD